MTLPKRVGLRGESFINGVEAQLAMIQLKRAKPEQVFLPYAINPQTGQTVYEMMIESKFERLALPAPKP